MERDNDKIRARAYDIWDRDGRQEGREQEHWLQAERELSVSAGMTATTEPIAAAAGVGQSASPVGEAAVAAPARNKANGKTAPATKTAAVKGAPAKSDPAKADPASDAAATAKTAAPRKRRGAQPQSPA